MLIQIGDRELDADRRETAHRGSPIEVEPKVFDCLVLLARKAGSIVTRDELIDHLWAGRIVSDSAISTVIKKARRVIGDDGRSPRLLKTVHRIGFRLDAAAVSSSANQTSGHGSGSGWERLGALASTELPLIGRESDLRRLEQTLLCAAQGEAQVVSISGPPGIGKSRLLAALGAAKPSRPFEVWVARGAEVAGTPAFWPWMQLIRSWLEQKPRVELVRDLGPGIADLASLVPELGVLCPPDAAAHPIDTAQARFRLFDAVAQSLRRASERAPQLLVFDDLHCADADSVLLWRFIAGAVSDKPVVLLGSYRSIEVSAGHPLARALAAVASEQGCVHIDLGPLDDADAFELGRATLGRPLPARLIDVLRDRAQGVPLFVCEFARHFDPHWDGALPAGSSADQENGQLPVRVRRVLDYGLSRLTPACRTVLGRAAAIGRHCSIQLLQATGDESASAFMTSLDEAADAKILCARANEPDVLEFTHVLVRDAAYESQPPSRRAALHLRIARAMEELGIDVSPTLLAHHVRLAIPLASQRDALRYSRIAAQAADLRMAYEEAVEQYSSCLALFDRGGAGNGRDRCELLLSLAAAQNRAGHPEASRQAGLEAVELGRRLGDRELLARAALGIGGQFGQPVEFGTFDETRIELLREALSGVDEESALGGLLYARLSTELHCSAEADQAAGLARRALEIARRVGDPLTTLAALTGEFIVRLRPDAAGPTIDIVDEIVDLASRIGHPELRVQAQMLRVVATLEVATSLESYDREREAHRKLASELRQPQALWWARVFEAARAAMLGAGEHVAGPSREALSIGRDSGSSNVIQSHDSQKLLRLITACDWEAAIALCTHHVEFTPRLAAWRTGLAFALMRSGRRSDYLVQLSILRGNGFEDLWQPSIWSIAAMLLTEILVNDGTRDEIEMIYSHLLPHRERNVSVGMATGIGGPLSLSLGHLAAALGRSDEAIRHFEHAVARCRALESRPWLARCQVVLAVHLRSEGAEPESVDALIEPAREVMRVLDLPILREAIGRIADSGSRPAVR